MLFPRMVERLGMLGFDVVAHHLPHRLVGFVDARVLEVQDGVDLVLEHQRPPAVLPAEAGEGRALAPRGLAVQVQLHRPPPLDAVLQLEPRAEEAPAVALRPEEGIEAYLQVAGFLHVMVVGHERRPFLGRGRRRPRAQNRQQTRPALQLPP